MSLLVEEVEDFPVYRVVLFILILAMFLFAAFTGEARARAGYAGWVKHGDIYLVDGRFGEINHKFNVEVAWKGSGFIITTPLGSYRLKRKGRDVSFKVYFKKAWAQITWNKTTALVAYKGQRGSANVKRLGNKKDLKKEPKRSYNFSAN